MNLKTNKLSDFYIGIIFAFITIQTVNADVTGEDNHHGTGNAENPYIYGHPGDSTFIDQVIEIAAIDIAFDPTLITIKQGETAKIIVKNNGKLLHELVLGTRDEHAMHREQMKTLSPTEMAETYGK